MAENQEPVKVEEQGPFIHQLQLFLVGGQQFTVNELSDSVKMPQNVIAFIMRGVRSAMSGTARTTIRSSVSVSKTFRSTNIASARLRPLSPLNPSLHRLRPLPRLLRRNPPNPLSSVRRRWPENE